MTRHTAFIPSLSVLLCAASLFLPTTPLAAQHERDDMAMARLLREVAVETAAQNGTRTVYLDIHPPEAPVMAWQVFSEELQRRGAEVRTDSEEGVMQLSVDIRGMHSSAVSIDNSSYLKTISLSAGVLLQDREGKQIAWSKEFTLSRSDTLRGDVAPGKRDFLAGSDASWLEAALAPLTVTVTAIILVTLLFTVRGS